MVGRTRELEWALGEEEKFVAGNEQETVIIQRRCLRAARSLKAGSVLSFDDIEVLRPAPQDAIFPYEIDRLVGKRLLQSIQQGEHFVWGVLEESQAASIEISSTGGLT